MNSSHAPLLTFYRAHEYVTPPFGASVILVVEPLNDILKGQMKVPIIRRNILEIVALARTTV